MAIERKVALQAATPQEVATTIVMSNKVAQDKDKRKIAKNLEARKSYKFKEDPFVEKLALEIEAKM